MNVGLPGTGIGGLFYLLAALLMPCVEVVQVLRGRSSLRRWKGVGIQSGFAAAILGGLWFTGLGLQFLLLPTGAEEVSVRLGQEARLFGLTPTLLSFVVLGVVLVLVELIALGVKTVESRSLTRLQRHTQRTK